MQAPTACAPPTWLSFGRLSGLRPSAWIWVWSWDPLRFARRHPSPYLSPAWADHPAGPDPEARLSRPKSVQQRSDQARKPVNSEQCCCCYPRTLTSATLAEVDPSHLTSFSNGYLTTMLSPRRRQLNPHPAFG